MPMADSKPTTPEDSPDNPPPPPGLPNDASWIMQGINQLNARIGELNTKIDRMDERLRTLENKFSKAAGWAMAIVTLMVLLQIALRFIKISVSIDP